MPQQMKIGFLSIAPGRFELQKPHVCFSCPDYVAVTLEPNADRDVGRVRRSLRDGSDGLMVGFAHAGHYSPVRVARIFRGGDGKLRLDDRGVLEVEDKLSLAVMTGVTRMAEQVFPAWRDAIASESPVGLA